MSKKQRKIGNRVNGFTHTLAHLMNLKENFEVHHEVSQREIDYALSLTAILQCMIPMKIFTVRFTDTCATATTTVTRSV